MVDTTSGVVGFEVEKCSCQAISECYIYANESIQALAPMSSETRVASNNADLLKNSSLYREFQAEREEILRHKWIESEKVGYDIGFEHALTDWIVRHRSKWRKSRQGQTVNN